MEHGKQKSIYVNGTWRARDVQRPSQVTSRSFRALQQSVKITDFILKPRERTDKDLEFGVFIRYLLQMGKETAGGKSGSREKQYRHLKEESGARDREGATDMGGSGMFGKS